MDRIFFIKLLISFLVGGTWITIITLVAEKYGSKIGGWIGGLPSTVLVALLFIALTQSPAAAVTAAVSIPAAIGMSGLFMVVYVLLSKRGFIVAISAALVTWFLAAIIFAISGSHTLWVSLVIFIVELFFIYVVLYKKLDIPLGSALKKSLSLDQIMLRALLSGMIVALAVMVSKLAGPYIGGIFSAFPAAFLSTLIIIHNKHGVHLSRAIAKTLTLSGLVNVTVYALAVHYTYTYFSTNILLATVLACLLTIPSVVAIYYILQKHGNI